MKIVILDAYGMNPGDLSWKPMENLGDVKLYDRTAPKDVMERSKDADILLTNKVVLNANTINKLSNLKYIGVLATGYNVVDIEAAKKHGIVVTNIPAYSTDSVAQLTFAHILNITNRVGHYAKQNREGKWSASKDFVYWDTALHELTGKKIGIIGLGHIGHRVAEIAAAFHMDITAVTSKNASDLPPFIRKTTISGLFAQSDIITLHCPLTPQTREMVNAESIKQMKDGAILINTSRGPLINEQDVADALTVGKLAGYGTDVLSTEPASKDNPLLKCPTAYITPHVAWATYEAGVILMDIATKNVEAFIQGKPQNVINL